MHYEDLFVAENSKLEIVIYKHETSEPGETVYELSSIQCCFLIHPKLVKDFIELFHFENHFTNVESKFPELKQLKTECFYVVKFIYDDNDFCLKIIDFSKASKDWELLH
jgi:hypothetical protein